MWWNNFFLQVLIRFMLIMVSNCGILSCLRLPEFLAPIALLELLALRQTNHQYATNTWRHLFLCYKDMPKNLYKNNGENLHIFWTTWQISMKFSGQMWLIESHKKSGLHPFYKLCIFGKTAGERVKLTPPKPLKGQRALW